VPSSVHCRSGGLIISLGVKGLNFSGFADFWWENHTVCNYSASASDYRDWDSKQDVNVVFISEPQIWYNVGRHFGCENLNIGSEVEFSYHFGTGKGFFARPCLGFKWVF